MIIHIKLDGNPSKKTAQQKGETIINGHIHHYEKKEVTRVKEAITWQLKPYAPEKPLEGPLYLKIEWRFELKRCKRRAWKVTRPDLDNLEKGLLDVFTDLHFWKDDSQVVMKSTCKKEVPPGEGLLEIRIEQIEGDNDG